MRKRKLFFRKVEPWPGIEFADWVDWAWQQRWSLTRMDEFARFFELCEDEKLGFELGEKLFRVRTTPYYASLMNFSDPHCALRRMTLPHQDEVQSSYQEMFDPLGERKTKNRVSNRLIHRYTDRVLFLVTDLCGIYCRYCTRKNFTAGDQILASRRELEQAVAYVKEHPEIKEVIFSGGDPLTLSSNKLKHYLEAFYAIDHVELIRLGTRMPVVNPMRVDQQLVTMLKEFQPIFIMTHFNHPDELTEDSALAIERFVDSGLPVFNQMVLLNGINNHPALVYALSRRLLYLRAKPHYMFQADPSIGTDHLRNSIDDSLNIQKSLWGHASGLAMPQYIVDIPDGGGKTGLTPNFQVDHQGHMRSFRGWDGVLAQYISPDHHDIDKPQVSEAYQQEWLSRY